ncbi:MAG: hypothetical protein KJ884_05870 [Gammaproteobacteria bacterium]|nr:hypothetical protein [Gammaproteobacteria bacterium]MBU1488707.1 hypothetical protein [Gammaproteobacteria bacterium]MBU2067236.1 hypothetical protein [Gammaproteobacteria bacterium]MBU2138832.1 hypothetical protein [Gammaproteobacteria bacterium]MBU2217519.1 hypothetical protein [Gammaproteobacteria bacterium]
MSSVTPTRIVRALLRGACLLCALSGLTCAALYATLYWPYRGQFEAGRYFEAGNATVYHEQTGLLLIPALLFLALAGWLAAMDWRRQARRPGSEK